MFRPCLERILLGIALLAVLILLPAPAEAAKLHFGPDEKLHVIAETKILNNGKPVSLCYKAYTFFLIGGVYTTDEYVLCEGGASTTYWPMPQGDKLAGLQQQGLLPSPLPAYERPAFDYVMGYSLWLLIVVVAVWGYLDGRRSKAAAPKKLALLQTTSRRLMASVAMASAAPDRSAAVARQIYQQIFGEPLTDADFMADWQWVQNAPAAFEGYVGAMGRRFDNSAKAMLLRAASHVAMADGTLESAEATLLHQIAGKLGMKPKEAEAFLQALRAKSEAPGALAV